MKIVDKIRRFSIFSKKEDKYMKPNYLDLGLSEPMGSILRNEVERQLIIDLNKYGVFGLELNFDWSDSCIEGKNAHLMGGTVDRFSGIKVFDKANKLIADGWMDFIYEDSRELFLVYWLYVDIYDNDVIIDKIDQVGVPNHILERLPSDLKNKYSSR